MDVRRFAIAGLVAVPAVVGSPASAGKLAGARNHVRHAEPAPAQAAPEEAPRAGQLAGARRQSRQVERRSAPSPRRRPRRRARPAWGFAYWDAPVVYPVAIAPCAPAPPLVDYQIAPIQPPQPASPVRPWTGRIHAEFGGASADVTRTGLGFAAESGGGLGIDFDFDSYQESLPDGGHDELHLGQVNATYRVFESDVAAVRAGLGVAWLGDRYGAEAGVNFTLQAETALARDWTASIDFDLGTLGDAQTQAVSATVGRRIGPCEIYGGYDYRRIGAIDLHGPMVGGRLRW